MRLDSSLDHFDPAKHLLKMEKQGDTITLSCEAKNIRTFVKAQLSKFFGEGKYQLPNIRNIPELSETVSKKSQELVTKINEAIVQYNKRHKQDSLHFLGPQKMEHPQELHEFDTTRQNIQALIGQNTTEQALVLLRTYREDHQVIICEQLDTASFQKVLPDLAATMLQSPYRDQLYEYLHKEKSTQQASKNCAQLLELLKKIDLSFPNTV